MPKIKKDIKKKTKAKIVKKSKSIPKVETIRPVEAEKKKETFSFARVVLLLVNCLGAIIFITLLALYVAVGANQLGSQNTNTSLINANLVYQMNLKNNYQAAVEDIQDKYLSLIENDQTRKASAKKALDEILLLRVPTEWKELHLGLVLAYQLMTNDDPDGEIFNSAKEKINSLVSEYPWLKGF